ncbi:hypothetical protein PspLS_08221 [Pyricularia sp. CBS 133598]|nr:hypothetical protein PspLS_08221 [Pyricularia sp. CBS 133598]
MSALARSRICRLEELACSIQSNELALPLDLDQTAKLRIICSRLKRFSVSITTPFLARRPSLVLPRPRSFYEPVDVVHDMMHIGCYKKPAPDLKKLRWKDNLRDLSEIGIHAISIVQDPYGLFVLAGFQAVRNDLEAFLLGLPQLRSLDLKHVRVSTSLSTQEMLNSDKYDCREWTGFIEGTLVERMPHLDTLRLSDFQLESAVPDNIFNHGRLCCLRFYWDEMRKTGHGHYKETTMPVSHTADYVGRDCIRITNTQVLGIESSCLLPSD